MKTLRLLTRTLFALLLLALVASAARTARTAASYGGWQAAWSRDGKRIAFTSGLPHSTSNIWLINANGGGMLQLTKWGGYNPVWSPDGRDIIFQSDRGLGPRYYSRPADGSGNDKLFDRLPAGAAGPAWSPDGKRIVYALVESGKQKTYVADLATGDRRELQGELAAREYAWSPDGKRLAIVTGEIIGDSLLEYDVATDKFEHVFHGYCSTPSYSPDGALLAFAAPLGSNRHRLFIVATRDKKQRKTEVNDFDGKSLSWSKDGHTLLFASTTNRQPAKIWTIRDTGQKLAAFKQTYEWAGNPRYSPSGDLILFEAVAKGSHSSDLFVCRADGSSVRRLTTTGSSYWQPQWSKGGKLVVLTDETGHGQVVLIDSGGGGKTTVGPFKLEQGSRISCSPDGSHVALVQGGQVTMMSLESKTPVANIVVRSEYPTAVSWSSDGKLIYYTDARAKGLGISSVDVGGKNREWLTPAKESSASPASGEADKAAAPPQAIPLDICPAASPDGKTIVFVRGRDLWMISADGTNERLFARSDAGLNDAVSYPTWSGDGGLILFQLQRRLENSLTYELWTVNSEGKDMKRVYQKRIEDQFDVYSEDSTNPAQLTPDGKSALITFVGEYGNPELWMIDIAGGQATQLTRSGATFPCLSADGKTLAYTGLEGDRETVRIMDMATRQSRTLPLN